jgi:hypothetical protein
MHDDKRTTGETQLSGVIERAMGEPGGLTITNLRGPGFRAMESMISADGQGFRALAPLPDRSQVMLDNAVVKVGLERLTFAADIMAAGLVYTLTDPLSVTQLAWNASNKVGAAQRTMSPSARGENKLPAVLENRLPVYLTTDNFSLDIRTLRMSQRVGLPLDTNLIEQCTRSVNEAIEDAAINGATTIDGQDLQVAGYKAPGLVNAPNAATQALTLASWDNTPVPATIYAEVKAMMTKLRANKKYGPYRLYVNTEVGANMDDDYVTAAPQNTIKERLMKLEGLQAIRTADLMPANKVVLVQMTSDVIDMVVGQTPTVIPYTSLDGFTFHNLVMAIMIPRVRYDYDNKSGICIGTIA